jgi:hypothetical protein
MPSKKSATRAGLGGWFDLGSEGLMVFSDLARAGFGLDAHATD